MRKILAALAALLFLAGQAPAQIVGRRGATLAYNYDLASGTLVYPVFLGAKGEPLTEFQSQVRVKTNGTPWTTLVPTIASTAPFQNVAVGDLLIFQRLGVNEERLIATRTDENEITVDAAIVLDTTLSASGFGFLYKNFQANGTATATPIPVHGFNAGVQFNVQVKTFAATSIAAQIECRQEGLGAGWSIVASKSFTATGSWDVFIELPFHECRLGMSVAGDVGAQSISAQFTGYYTAR